MFDRVLGEKVYCGLDIGSKNIKACVVKMRTTNDFDVLGVYESKTMGFKDGSVRDLGELTECIHRTMNSLIKKAGVEVQDVQLGIGGNLIEIRHSRGVIPLVDQGNKVINQSDITKINHQARLLGVKMDEELLHDFPQYYKVDDVNTALNPLGLYGRKLEANLLLILSKELRLNNMIKAVRQAGLEVSHLLFNSFAASLVCLNEQSKQDGCLFIDIGASTTDILIFKYGFLHYLAHIPWGGDHMTRRLAQTLSLSFDLAEEIKKSYASAVKIEENFEEEILVKQETGYLPIRKVLISQAVEPEMCELIQNIEGHIQKSGLADQLNAGFFLSGGGALLPGLVERIEGHFRMNTQLGQIQMSQKGIRQGSIFAGAVGLIQTGFIKDTRDKFSFRGDKHGWFKGLKNRIKELYQEYF